MNFQKIQCDHSYHRCFILVPTIPSLALSAIQSSIVVPGGTPIKLSFSIYLHFHFHFHLLLLETDLILDCTVQYCTVDSVYTEWMNAYSGAFLIDLPVCMVAADDLRSMDTVLGLKPSHDTTSHYSSITCSNETSHSWNCLFQLRCLYISCYGSGG